MKHFTLGDFNEKTQKQLLASIGKQGDPGPVKKRHKYNAKPTVYNGRTYSTKGEAHRAKQLDLLIETRVITAWIPQPIFFLPDPTSTSRADFLVGRNDEVWVEDVKGVETDKFLADKKRWLVHGRLPLRILKRKGDMFEITETIQPREVDGERDN